MLCLKFFCNFALVGVNYVSSSMLGVKCLWLVALDACSDYCELALWSQVIMGIFVRNLKYDCSFVIIEQVTNV